MLLHRCLDGFYLLWLDQCGAIFDQGDHAVDALADGVAGWDLRNWFALTLARTTKVVARLAGPGLPPVEHVRHSFAIGVADRHLDSPSSPSTRQVMRHAEPFLSMGIAPDVARITLALATRFHRATQAVHMYCFSRETEKYRCCSLLSPAAMP